MKVTENAAVEEAAGAAAVISRSFSEFSIENT